MSSEAVSAVPARRPKRATTRSYSAWALWILMTILATFIAVASARYFFPAPLPPSANEFVRHFDRFLPRLLPHVAGAVVALLLGPWQFVAGLRNRYLHVHRWLGRIYLIAVLIGGIGALVMAPVSLGGMPAHVGFGMLGGLWLLTGAFAYREIRRGNIRAHQQWMIRNYSLTFAAVTLRLWGPLFYIHIDPIEAYKTVAWLGWVPNLMVAEIIVSRIRATA
jgi:uncharacterized membrane protein